MHDQEVIKCLVVDDEPPARELICRYVNQVPRLGLVGEATNALEAMRYLQGDQIDLLFLDINMPQLNGIEFLRTLMHPPKVILTTAYPEFAIEGYELDVLDYLLKPIPFDRFLKAVNKIACARFPRNKVPVAVDKSAESFVYFRVDRRMVKVMLADIFYIESMKDYIKVFTKQGMLITKQSMSSVEAMLPEREFIRAHRSYLVSVKHIRTYNNEMLEIAKEQIPIGKIYRQSVMKRVSYA